MSKPSLTVRKFSLFSYLNPFSCFLSFLPFSLTSLSTKTWWSCCSQAYRMLWDFLPKGFIWRQSGLISFSEYIWNFPQWGKRSKGEASGPWSSLLFTIQVCPIALKPINMPFIHHWSNTCSIEVLCFMLVSASAFVAGDHPMTFDVAPKYNVLVIKLSWLQAGDSLKISQWKGNLL